MSGDKILNHTPGPVAKYIPCMFL